MKVRTERILQDPVLSDDRMASLQLSERKAIEEGDFAEAVLHSYAVKFITPGTRGVCCSAPKPE